MEKGKVTFKYKDSKTKLWKFITLNAEEFIRRFLQHVLPSGFVKVRYYGLFAVKNRTLLEKTKVMLGCRKKEKRTNSQTKKSKVFKCPVCKKEMVIVLSMPRPACNWNKAPPITKISSDNPFINQCA